MVQLGLTPPGWPSPPVCVAEHGLTRRGFVQRIRNCRPWGDVTVAQQPGRRAGTVAEFFLRGADPNEGETRGRVGRRHPC